jgi:Flp pilus assembly protein TadG
MRVRSSLAGRLPSRRCCRGHDERGAIAVIVAIVLVLLMSMVAFALDSGNGWQTRRHLITATDSASLAAAETYAEGANGCGGVASSYTTSNVPNATVTGCAMTTFEPGAGMVTVSAQVPWHMNFAGIMGFGDRNVHSTTTAAFGKPLGVYGLRPLALCNASTAFKQWLTSNMTTGFTATIPYGKSAPGDCGANVPGNWGIQDFNGGANSDQDIKNWLQSGYPGLVTAPSSVPGNPGAFSNSLGSALDYLVTNQIVFALPVYDSASGNGNNAQFHVIGFVSARLDAYQATGSAASRWLQITFLSHVVQGTCCSHGGDTGTRVVFICAVDASFPAANCKDH